LFSSFFSGLVFFFLRFFGLVGCLGLHGVEVDGVVSVLGRIGAHKGAHAVVALQVIQVVVGRVQPVGHTVDGDLLQAGVHGGHGRRRSGRGRALLRLRLLDLRRLLALGLRHVGAVRDGILLGGSRLLATGLHLGLLLITDDALGLVRSRGGGRRGDRLHHGLSVGVARRHLGDELVAEALVVLGVLQADGTGNAQALLGQRRRGEALRHGLLHVRHIGRPGQRAGGSGLALAGRGLDRGGGLRRGRHHARGQLLVQQELVTRAQALDLGHDCGDGHFKLIVCRLACCWGLDFCWKPRFNFYIRLKSWHPLRA
jgi:hypothetical protein